MSSAQRGIIKNFFCVCVCVSTSVSHNGSPHYGAKKCILITRRSSGSLGPCLVFTVKWQTEASDRIRQQLIVLSRSTAASPVAEVDKQTRHYWFPQRSCPSAPRHQRVKVQDRWGRSCMSRSRTLELWNTKFVILAHMLLGLSYLIMN